MPGADHHDLIGQSHRRSQSYGITVTDEPDFSSPAHGVLPDALEENRFLFQHAAPVMETLYDQIVNTHSMVLLTSARGLVLHSLGDMDFLERASQVALTPGMDWSEKSKGTNAIGTALSEEEALTVHGGQHYMNANKFLTCSASPIFDPYGQVIGALDVTGDHRSYHQHTLALVRMSAQMIENHMFADIFPKAIRIHFHTRSEFLGTLVEGIAVFSPEGRFLSANRSAQFQIGLPFSALKAHTFSSLFGLPVSALFELFGGATPNPKQLCMHNGVSVWCRVKLKASNMWAAKPGTHTGEAPAQPQAPQAPAAPAAAQPGPEPLRQTGKKMQFSSLHYLDTGDAQVTSVIHKLRMVSGRDIPIMILGETGTGKDLLAQAIHGDSTRAAQPFVSVNCASIPDTLIESELFGYEEGAFTGARKKGSIGKILQAHGGTLFLDEIGDMPKHLQARLLRVLQERKVSPLGAGKEVEVDVAVVSATHKNLKDMIARGDFREDLYYRLNGLVVRLPALRERSDFELVVQKILLALSEGSQPVGVSAPVMDLFKRYAWPGNFRQLHNLLRTAVVMVGQGGVIDMSHLPDDFLEELDHEAVMAPSVAPAVPIVVPVDAAPAGHTPEPVAEVGTEGQRLQDVALGAMAQMLRLHKGNVSAAAKALGVSRNTIYRKKDQLPPDLLN
ncbi:sigma-54-dependent Fis family transcriptional regulator [Hydrogenophaga sp.]|uniref:sigma-54-dependent Fis family transcriptional regulator n=1 Tax=Hydrogenophaga sp. TaxID=1904254 RepID=UPI0026285278|nr:sigma-54-dependent Fis family transcriptional regulator [Hydrogenophaga sp.]